MGSKNDEFIGTEKRMVLSRGFEVGEKGGVDQSVQTSSYMISSGDQMSSTVTIGNNKVLYT